MKKSIFNYSISMFIVLLFLTGCDNNKSIKGESYVVLKTTNIKYKVPSDFTGNYCLIKDGVKVEETDYVNGKKNGKSIYRYEDTGNIMSIHDYGNGILDGPYVKYYNVEYKAIIASGIYKNGKPWAGNFIEKGPNKVDTSPQVADSNLKPFLLEYKDGILLNPDLAAIETEEMEKRGKLPNPQKVFELIEKKKKNGEFQNGRTGVSP